MPAPSTTKCDIELTNDLKIMAFDAGVIVKMMYWNIHGKVVLIVKDWPNAIIGVSPADTIRQAEKLFGGL